MACQANRLHQAGSTSKLRGAYLTQLHVAPQGWWHDRTKACPKAELVWVDR